MFSPWGVGPHCFRRTRKLGDRVCPALRHVNSLPFQPPQRDAEQGDGKAHQGEELFDNEHEQQPVEAVVQNVRNVVS